MAEERSQTTKSAVDDEVRGLAQSPKLADSNPWKVHVPGLEEQEEQPLEATSAETDAWDGSPPPGLGDIDADQYVGKYMDSMTEGWWSQADAWNSALSWLSPGDIVCFHGLQKTTSLNGVCATVEGWDEASDIWSVVLASGEKKYAKAENLAVVQAQACSYSAAACLAAAAAAESQWWWSNAAKNKGRSKEPQAARKPSGGARQGVTSRTSSLGSDVTTASGGSGVSQVSGEAGSEGSQQNSDQEDPAQPWTTVMMRNIPNDYTGSMLLDLLNEHGFAGLYNLVYLPMDYHRKAGFGYAFIDFITTEEAQRFREYFEGFSDWGLVSHKICSVSWSDALQGVQAHIDRYRNSPVMHDAVPDEFKPMLFENGKRVPFPVPTKSIRAPRLRKKAPKPVAQQPREQRRQVV